ncbi:hypothetical protein HMPREF9176_1657 [Streptococcus downei F0415]|nr:hypothetical protein HMPREF9176_1657 [Streptococcus downei F0415]
MKQVHLASKGQRVLASCLPQLTLKKKENIMKIEHLAIYVNDLEGAKEFFSKLFSSFGQPTLP